MFGSRSVINLHKNGRPTPKRLPMDGCLESVARSKTSKTSSADRSDFIRSNNVKKMPSPRKSKASLRRDSRVNSSRNRSENPRGDLQNFSRNHSREEKMP